MYWVKEKSEKALQNLNKKERNDGNKIEKIIIGTPISKKELTDEK